MEKNTYSPRPFEETRQRVKEAYEDAYLGEKGPLSASEIDINKPYTIVNNEYYQAQFRNIRMVDHAPAILPSIRLDLPLHRKSITRKANETLLYVFADTASSQPYQTGEEITGLYGVGRRSMTKDKKDCIKSLLQPGELSTLEIISGVSRRRKRRKDK